MKMEQKKLDKLEAEDPEGYLEKLNQLERDRALERVSLKHRGGSKFAKRQMIYAKYDDRVGVMYNNEYFIGIISCSSCKLSG